MAASTEDVTKTWHRGKGLRTRLGLRHRGDWQTAVLAPSWRASWSSQHLTQDWASRISPVPGVPLLLDLQASPAPGVPPVFPRDRASCSYLSCNTSMPDFLIYKTASNHRNI